MKNNLVLIVENNEHIRTLYNEALTQAGIEVLLAEDGESGVKMALEHHPDVTLMDIMMPGMDGHEAVKAIRRDDWGKTARVIYLTNLSQAEDVFKAIEQKPEEYIVKANTDVKEVVNKVRMALYKDE